MIWSRTSNIASNHQEEAVEVRKAGAITVEGVTGVAGAAEAAVAEVGVVVNEPLFLTSSTRIFPSRILWRCIIAEPEALYGKTMATGAAHTRWTHANRAREARDGWSIEHACCTKHLPPEGRRYHEVDARKKKNTSETRNQTIGGRGTSANCQHSTMRHILPLHQNLQLIEHRAEISI